jgi:hypothetical protein
MINSYAYRVDPTGTEKLGSSTSRDRYKECLPGVYEDTYVLEALTETTTIQHCGDFSLPLHQTVAHTSRAIRETEVRNYITLKKWPNNLTDTLVMSSLVGRKQLGFTHEPIEEFVERVRMERERVMSIGPATLTSRYSVVAFEFSLLDIETGEVFDQLPQIITALLDELDLGCLVYKIGSYDFVALLNFGLPKSYDYAIKQLKQIARLINAKGSYKVSARNSSLFNVFPLPLSVTRDGVFCEILDVDVKDSISAIKQFLSFKPGAKESGSAPIVKSDSEDEPAPLEEDYSWRKDHDFAVTRVFYSGINKLIGKNKNKDKIRKLIGYLLFSTFKDDNGFLILSSSKLCTLLYGDDKRVQQNNFNLSATLKLLEPFVSISTAQHIYKEKKATILKTAEFHEDINVLAAEEYKWIRRDLVWLSSGESCNEFEKHNLKEAREKAIREDCFYPVEIAKTLLSTLNSLPSHTFTAIYNEGINSALDAVSFLPASKRDTAINQIHNIRLQPIPIYSIKPGTSRIYPEFYSFAYLNKTIRKQFFKGKFLADLKHCHLSIFAHLWNVDELFPYLKEEDSWAALESLFLLPKPILKELIMPLLYGETKEAFNETTATKDEIEKFLNHPIVEEMLKKKADYLKEADLKGYGFDAFRNKIIQKGHHHKQFLSQISQSYEFFILGDIYESYVNLKDKNTSKKFNILLYLFDGFIFDCNSRDFQRIKRDMEISVEQKLSILQIPTKLVIEEI